MTLRIASRADAEIPLLFNLLNQFACIFILIWEREFGFFRDIPPESQDILNIVLPELPDHFVDVLPGG